MSLDILDLEGLAKVILSKSQSLGYTEKKILKPIKIQTIGKD